MMIAMFERLNEVMSKYGFETPIEGGAWDTEGAKVIEFLDYVEKSIDELHAYKAYDYDTKRRETSDEPK